MTIASIILIVFLMKKPPEPESAPYVPPPPPATKKVEPKAMSTIKEIPDETRKEIYKRLDVYSTQVDTLEKRQIEIEKIADAEKRYAELDKLSEDYAGVREGIADVLEDSKYELYRTDPAYGPMWQGYANRLNFYQVKMNQLKKLRDAAFNEVQSIKIKKEKEGK